MKKTSKLDFDVDNIDGRERKLKLMQSDNRMTLFLNKLRKSNQPVILYGASLCGIEYLNLLNKNGIDVYCFLDDDIEKQKNGVSGKKVLSPVNCKEKYEIIISSFGPRKLYENLMQAAPSLMGQVHMVDFYLYEDGLDYYDYFLRHRHEIDEAADLLADKKSLHVFENLLQYKISRDPNLIDEIRDDVELQYFDSSIVSLSDQEIFLDLGAYNGDTIINFIKAVHRRYCKVIAVEPDDGNYEMLLRQVSAYENIDCHCCGVFEKDGTVPFNADSTWTSAVNENGKESIIVRSVDSLLQGADITFLKADIEGTEEAMLLGAAATIRRCHPKLAIAVYHRKQDIFHLIHIIHSYNHDYKFYLRHYTEMPIDTVLYAV